jgi:hypothetical protein
MERRSMTLFITHPACHEHLTPPDHPERPDRLRAIEQELEHEKFAFLLREQCPRAELEIVALCHPWEYIERIRRAVPRIGLVQLDDDTVLSAGSFEASLRAAGGAILAVDEVERRKTRSSRSARPVITQKPLRRWVFVFSTMQPLRSVMRSDAMAQSAWRLSISMPITAMAPSKSSGAIGR